MESTPLTTNNYKTNRSETKSLDMLSPIISSGELEFDFDDKYGKESEDQETSGTSGIFMEENGTVSYNIDDISTWIGGIFFKSLLRKSFGLGRSIVFIYN